VAAARRSENRAAGTARGDAVGWIDLIMNIIPRTVDIDADTERACVKWLTPVGRISEV
jgi:hypothetical protein